MSGIIYKKNLEAQVKHDKLKDLYENFKLRKDEGQKHNKGIEGSSTKL